MATEPTILTVVAIIEKPPILTPFKGTTPNPVQTEGQLWPRGNS